MEAVAATGDSREARRRRIVERGADRLALLTGRIQALPPDTDQSRYSTCPPGQFLADVAQQENIACISLLPDHKKSDAEPSQLHNIDKEKEPSVETNDKTKTISSKPVTSLGVEEEQSQIPDQVNQVEHRHRNSFTTSQISSAISASEKIRMYCSVAVAILVMSSYIEFPFLGSRIIRSALIFKPFYMLLLTNITIVLARLISGTQGPESRKGLTSIVPKFSGDGLVDQLGKALELGLLLQKIFEAMFIDFGIYAVVLICSLSLVRILGW